mmetsp:Transcript_47195/g.120403  ORF Transcript_47195/g.120403 Transcript_47195/m.120403 type:complete len:207 (-) Transcript_47195:1405-2025(-)
MPTSKPAPCLAAPSVEGPASSSSPLPQPSSSSGLRSLPSSSNTTRLACGLAAPTLIFIFLGFLAGRASGSSGIGASSASSGVPSSPIRRLIRMKPPSSSLLSSTSSLNRLLASAPSGFALRAWTLGSTTMRLAAWLEAVSAQEPTVPAAAPSSPSSSLSASNFAAAFFRNRSLGAAMRPNEALSSSTLRAFTSNTALLGARKTERR